MHKQSAPKKQVWVEMLKIAAVLVPCALLVCALCLSVRACTGRFTAMLAALSF